MENDLTEIKKAALGYLAQREHSRWELYCKLQQRDFELAAIETVLQTLIDKNLLSDQRFTTAYVHARVARGFGPLHLTNELRERHVAEELITEALGEYAECWDEHIRLVRNKKFGVNPPANINQRATQVRFLLYRGFTMEQINQLFKEEIL